MYINSPADITASYNKTGQVKANKSASQLLVLSIMAGMTIAFGGAVSNTAIHAIDNISYAKVVSGLIFPFGLCIILLMGMELFTSNIMISISVMHRETGVLRMLRNWFLVYIGNAIGSLAISAGIVYSEQLNYSSKSLAVYSMKLALVKINQPSSKLLVSGILCNLLVCTAVLCFYAAKETIAKLVGCYLPIAYFVIAGFEHCVANMYYLSVSLFARLNPSYAALAVEAGLDLSKLTVANALLGNLLPVTLGNIIGGLIVSLGMVYAHGNRELMFRKR